MDGTLRDARGVRAGDRIWTGRGWEEVTGSLRDGTETELYNGERSLGTYVYGDQVMVRGTKAERVQNIIHGNPGGVVIQGRNFGEINL